MAGFTVRECLKSRQGRKVLADGHQCLPSLTGLGKLGCDIPSHKWLGYCRIQVKQKDKAGRPDIDAFEAMMMREDCEKGFFVSFDCKRHT
jgi:hypothetical protein